MTKNLANTVYFALEHEMFPDELTSRFPLRQECLLESQSDPDVFAQGCRRCFLREASSQM